MKIVIQTLYEKYILLLQAAYYMAFLGGKWDVSYEENGILALRSELLLTCILCSFYIYIYEYIILYKWFSIED